MATTTALTGSASLLHNNLAIASTGMMAVIHNSVNTGANVSEGYSRLLMNRLGGASHDGPQIGQAMSVRYLEMAYGPVLVVTSTNGTQIYNEDATSMLFFVPINDTSPDTETLKHHQGACVVPALQHIVIGTSKGSLMVVQATSADQMIALPESPPAGETVGVSDVCYSEVSNAVVSAHHNGELRVWTLNEAGYYSNPTVVPAVNQAPVRVASLGARLLVGYGPGTFLLFDAVTFDALAEVTAHARWMTALVVREDVGFVATVGEDTVLNVWQVDAATGRVGLQHTSVVTDKLLTGVALTAQGAVVAAYDSADLYNVTL